MKYRQTLLAAVAIPVLSLALSACTATGEQGKATTEGQQIGADSRLRVADSTYAAGDYKTAASMYSRIIMEDSNNVTARLRLADTYLTLGMPQEAYTQYSNVLRIDAKNTAALRGAGRSQIAMRNGEAAAGFFEQALALEESTANYAAYGVAQDLAGRHGEAQANYRKGLVIDPYDVTLRNNMGLSLLLVGEPEAAIAVLKSVVADPRATAQHRSNLALAYGVSGKENAAKRLLQQDLEASDVARNLGIYDTIRGLYGRSLREAILLGDGQVRPALAPSLPNPEPE